MAEYKFVDHWYIKAPIDVVYQHIADPRTYPQWWPVYSHVKVIKDVPFPHIGGRANLLVNSFLGYKLNIEVETTRADPPKYLMTVSEGNLEGSGEWIFTQEGETTHAQWTWIVHSNHRLLNLLEPVAKPLFAYSHTNASEKGHQGLKKFLEK
jgi:hypothetical protein